MHPISLFQKLLSEEKIAPEEFKEVMGLLDEATQKQYHSVLTKGLSSIQLTKEEKEFAEKLLKIKNYEIPDFNFQAYSELLFLTRLACKFEKNTGAELHALKLVILFGTTKHALDYLGKFQKLNPEKQLIHDACLYEPPSGKLNYHIWQSIAVKTMPNEDLERILPHAVKIQQYIEKNRASYEKEIWESLIQNQELALSIEQDQKEITESDYIKEQMKLNAKKMSKKVDERLYNWAKQKLTNENTSATPIAINKYRGEKGGEQKKLFQQEIQQEFEELFKKQFKERSPNSEKSAKIKAQLEDLKLLRSSPPTAQYLEKSKQTGIRKILEDNFKTSANNIYSKETKLETLMNYAAHVSYTRSNQNIAASKLFFTLGISEESYNQYLGLKPLDDEKQIPEVFINGDKLGYPGFYIKKLSPKDPRAAVLGKLTSCCQSLGCGGEEPAIFGITNQRAGFYVLCQKKSTTPTNTDPILSQCLAWRGKNEDMVFDSIESQVNFRESNKQLIANLFLSLSNHLIKEYKIPMVLVGEGGQTPSFLGAPIHYAETPVKYKGYRDSNSQRMLNAANFSLIIKRILESKQHTGSKSKIKIGTESKIDAEFIEEICSIWGIVQVNTQEEVLEEIMQIGKHLNLSRDHINTRLEYFRLLNKTQWTAEELKQLFDGVRIDIKEYVDLINDTIVKSIVANEEFQLKKDHFKKLNEYINREILATAIIENKTTLTSFLIENKITNLDIDLINNVIQKWSGTQRISKEVLINLILQIGKHSNLTKELLDIQLEYSRLMKQDHWTSAELKQILDGLEIGMSINFNSKQNEIVKSIATCKDIKFKKEYFEKLSTQTRQQILSAAISNSNNKLVLVLIENKLVDINDKDIENICRAYAKDNIVKNQLAIEEITKIGDHLNLPREQLIMRLEHHRLLQKNQWTKEELMQLFNGIEMGIDKDIDWTYLALLERLTDYKDITFKKSYFMLDTIARYMYFSKAIKNNNIKLVMCLVENDLVDVNASLGSDLTPLKMAVGQSDTEMVKYLIQHGAKTDNHLLFYEAIRHNKISNAQYLMSIQNFDINATPPYSNSAIAEAVKHNNLDAIKYLLDLKATLDSELMRIAVENSQIDTVKYLVNMRAKTDDKLLFHYAISGNKLETAKYIEQLQGKVNVNEPFGRYTILEKAVRNNNIDMVKYLLDLKVNINEGRVLGDAARYQISILPVLLAEETLNVDNVQYYRALEDCQHEFHLKELKLLRDRREKSIPPSQLIKISFDNISPEEKEKKYKEFQNKGKEIIEHESKGHEKAVKEIAKQIYYIISNPYQKIPPNPSENIQDNINFQILIGMGKLDFSYLIRMYEKDSNENIVNYLSRANFFTKQGIQYFAKNYITFYELLDNSISKNYNVSYLTMYYENSLILFDKTQNFRLRHFIELPDKDRRDIKEILLSPKGIEVLRHDLIDVNSFLNITDQENRKKFIDELSIKLSENSNKAISEKDKIASSLQGKSLFSETKQPTANEQQQIQENKAPRQP